MTHPASPPDWLQPLIDLSDRVAASVAFGTAFVEAPAQLRAQIVAGWKFGVEWEYPSPWRLPGLHGGPGSPEERIVATLILHGLERQVESREELLLYCVAYNSCKLAGLDPDVLFARCAAALPATAAGSLTRFVARAPKDKSLEAFLLKTQASADGELEIVPPW